MSSTDKITRRDFLKGALTVGSVLLTGTAGYQAIYRTLRRDFQQDRKEEYLRDIKPPKNPNRLPNIILIVADDLGFGDIGVSGSTIITTPNMDKMAEEGTRLSHFYSAAPLCSPSRAGLLSGRYPIRTMVTGALYPSGSLMNPLLDVAGFYTLGIRGMPTDEVLLSEILKQRGYKTGIIGKWHLGDRQHHLPNDFGFDYFFGALYSNNLKRYEIFQDRHVAIHHPVDQNQLTQWMTQEAAAFIEKNSDQPFFLYLAHPMPHEPVHASAAFRNRSAAGLYGDCIQEIDWSLAEILATLRKLGIDEKTMVIFTSDNGPWWQGNPGFNRGRKNLPFEGGYRVPFIARWPGVIPAGYVSDEMSMNFDLFATCLDIAGINPPNDRKIDGRSILPLLQGREKSPHNTLYFFKGKKLLGVRHLNWKYLRRHMTDNGGYASLSQGPFLFNLDTDPNESYNMIEAKPEIADGLCRSLSQFDQEIQANIRGWL